MKRTSDGLHVLPLTAELARERASEDRLAEAPRAIQEWFDAQADSAGSDAELRRFVSQLTAEGNAPASAEGDALADDSVSPAVCAWLAATAHDPDTDARLWAFVDQLAPEDPATASTPASVPPALGSPPVDPASAANQLPRWIRPAIAASLLLAASSFATSVLLTGDHAVAPVASEQSTVRGEQAQPTLRRPDSPSPSAAPAGGAPEASTDPVVVAAAAAQGSGVPPGTRLGEEAQASDPASSTPPASSVLASADPTGSALAAGSTVAAPGAAPAAAPAAAASEATSTAASAAPSTAPSSPPPNRVVIVQADPPVDLAAALQPPSEPLKRSGDIAAHTGTWREDVVPGLDLRLVDGFGHLQGTEASPELVLADDALIRVDIDRSMVRDDFRQFTVHTRSGTVTVLGTRYSVETNAGRTHVETRRGLVKVTCADGRENLVAAGQAADCDPVPDTRVLTHMQAMDRAPGQDSAILSAQDRYDVLIRLLSGSSPESFMATADIMLGRAIADADYRKAIELARIDAMCALAWDEPARDAARSWMQAPAAVSLEHARDIAETGCD